MVPLRGDRKASPVMCLRVEIEGWVDPGLTVASADALGQQVALLVARQVPDMRSFTWTARVTA
jgi:hypothetical protein